MLIEAARLVFSPFFINTKYKLQNTKMSVCFHNGMKLSCSEQLLHRKSATGVQCLVCPLRRDGKGAAGQASGNHT